MGVGGAVPGSVSKLLVYSFYVCFFFGGGGVFCQIQLIKTNFFYESTAIEVYLLPAKVSNNFEKSLVDLRHKSVLCNN